MSIKDSSIYVVGRNQQVVTMFTQAGCRIADSPDVATAVVFTGGADVHPFLYGQKVMRMTRPDWLRDRNEIRIFKSLPRYMPKLGICRGAQFLNVMSGGSMWQHVTNHANGQDHNIKLVGWDVTRIIEVTSTHHQMMRPSEDGWIIGAGNQASIKMAEGVPAQRWASEEERAAAYDDPEIVYYSNTNSLCFQPHPEYRPGACRDLFFECIQKCEMFNQGAA